jgi:hypothetical protein
MQRLAVSKVAHTPKFAASFFCKCIEVGISRLAQIRSQRLALAEVRTLALLSQADTCLKESPSRPHRCETSYGTFRYRVDQTEIVDPRDIGVLYLFRRRHRRHPAGVHNLALLLPVCSDRLERGHLVKLPAVAGSCWKRERESLGFLSTGGCRRLLFRLARTGIRVEFAALPQIDDPARLESQLEFGSLYTAEWDEPGVRQSMRTALLPFLITAVPQSA